MDLLENRMKPLKIEGLAVSRETSEKLEIYYNLLLKWQKTINLISPKTVSDAWDRHFLDSVQIAPLIGPEIKIIYDIGSGAGFPGMVMAILFPDAEVTLIESDSKKCAFLRTVSRETSVKVKIQNDRIEAITGILPPPHLVTARALSPLAALLDYIAPWALEALNLQAIFPKGAGFAEEITAARAAGWDFDCSETRSVTEPSAKILHLRHIKKGV